jgi:NAD(P)-dependent dehydrogenase (short-subunit alcohol dehydrogenase family)
MSDRLRDKIAIVTGGASGIGLEIAKGFALEGATICIADVAQAAWDEAASAVSRSAFGNELDVRDRRSMDKLLSRTVGKAGGVDILVNCAGVFGMQNYMDITEQEFDRIFAVNARGLRAVRRSGGRANSGDARGTAREARRDGRRRCISRFHGELLRRRPDTQRRWWHVPQLTMHSPHRPHIGI